MCWHWRSSSPHSSSSIAHSTECELGSKSHGKTHGRRQTENFLPIAWTHPGGWHFFFLEKIIAAPGWFQGPDVKHDLPALQLGQLAERWHPAARISVRDFPEERPI